MNKLFYALLVSLISLSIVQAQPNREGVDESSLPGKRSDLNVRRAMYPRVLPDNRVEFKITQPEAKRLQIDLGRKYDMVRNDAGEWTCTTDPLTRGFHYYFLIVDGVSVADPASESFFGCSMMTSGVEIPYPEGVTDFYLADVPHGDVRMKRYFSKTANDWRRMFVYTPPCYEKSNKSYPVLYLLHGGGEDERGWSQQGRTDIIMDNLIAANKAVPMVIVMTDGNTHDFASELLNDCIPFVEQNFRVKSDSENRALAGLSMGGVQTLNTAIAHPELFSYIGVFSSGWWLRNPSGSSIGSDADRGYTLLKEKKAFYNKQFKQFWISMGGEEDFAHGNCQAMMRRFDEIGINYTYTDIPGGHTWPVWRESLHQFAPLLFQK